MLIALLTLATLSTQDGAAPTVAYRIEARVEDPEKLLYGRETVRWTNPTLERTRELWFHLYLNAFSNNRSTHLVESKGSLRGLEVERGWGWQRVSSIRFEGDELIERMRYAAPDDDNPEDRTVAVVELPRPIDPGETIEFELSWESQLPHCLRRTGVKGDFIFAAQWFPKLGVFEGERGWNCHQFHASTEFFADYGTYDVVLDLPERYAGKVFGSGVVAEPSEVRGDRVRTTIHAPSLADRKLVDSTGGRPLVHDFTWTADPRFVVVRGRFVYADWAARFPDEVAFARSTLGVREDVELSDVAITLLIHPEREEQADRHIEAASAALFFYGLWFGGYPYEHVTVVDPAWGASAGGMEYPTLFTAGTRLFTTPDMHSPEGVTVHECGHQFWYGLVGNNEFESSWMDEGFNSFTDSEVMHRVWGRQRATTNYCGLYADGVPPTPLFGGSTLGDALSARKIPIPWLGELEPVRTSGFLDWWRDQPGYAFAPQSDDPRWSDRSRYLSDPDRDPLDTPAWLYADSGGYRTNSYQRPAIALRSLPAAIENEETGVDGHALFLRGMRHYAKSWRYRHPQPDDFFEAFQEGAGVDVSWYFRDLFRGTGTIDWRVAVDVRKEAAPKGLFQPEPGEAFAAAKREAAGKSDAGDDAGDDAGNGDGGAAGGKWTSEVTVSRRGELVLPVPVRLWFDDGTQEDVLWTRAEQEKSRWLRIERSGPKKVVAAAVDPDRGYLLDTDLSNNRWYEETATSAPERWLERAFARNAMLLWWQAGLGG